MILAILAAFAAGAFAGGLLGLWAGAMLAATADAFNRYSEPPIRNPEWRTRP